MRSPLKKRKKIKAIILYHRRLPKLQMAQTVHTNTTMATSMLLASNYPKLQIVKNDAHFFLSSMRHRHIEKERDRGRERERELCKRETTSTSTRPLCSATAGSDFSECFPIHRLARHKINVSFFLLSFLLPNNGKEIPFCPLKEVPRIEIRLGSGRAMRGKRKTTIHRLNRINQIVVEFILKSILHYPHYIIYLFASAFEAHTPYTDFLLLLQLLLRRAFGWWGAKKTRQANRNDKNIKKSESLRSMHFTFSNFSVARLLKIMSNL